MALQGELLHFFKLLPGYDKYSERIKKTLYYGKMPSSDRPSFPMTGLLVKKFNSICKKEKLERLNLHTASSICYESCVTPCSVIISLLYLDRLRKTNPEYLEFTSPSRVFIVAMMVASKYLYDDGEEDEVYNDEWAASAAMLTFDLNEAEREFLTAIDWNLYIDMKAFINALLYVEVQVAKNQALSRGYFTYTDLAMIAEVLPSIWTTFISILSSALVVCFVGYAATVFSVTVGSLVAIRCNSYLMDAQVGQAVDISTCSHENFTDGLVTGDNSQIQDEICFDEPTSVEMDQPYSDVSNTSHHSPLVRRRPRFHTLRTLTAALLLASSTSGQYVHSKSPKENIHLPTTHPPFIDKNPPHGMTGPYWLPENVSSNFDCLWKCHGYVCGNSCTEQYSNIFPQPSNKSLALNNEFRDNSRPLNKRKLGTNSFNQILENGDLHNPEPFESGAPINLRKIILRSEFMSITTGNYLLPSSTNLRTTVNEHEVSTYKENHSHCAHCSNEATTIFSKFVHKWVKKTAFFMHWNSLPPDKVENFHLEAVQDVSFPTMGT